MCIGHGPKPVYTPGSTAGLDMTIGVEQRIKRALARDAGRYRRAWRQVCVSPTTWGLLQDSLASRGSRPVSVQVSGFEFGAITLVAATGRVDILSDVHVPDDSLCFLEPNRGWSGGGVVDNKYASWNGETVDFWNIPPPSYFDPDPKPEKAPPAKCSKCQEPFPYEAHESGKCYRCRGGK